MSAAKKLVPPKKPYYCETRFGFVVQTELRGRDSTVLVVVHCIDHPDTLLKLMPVETDEELSQWFWGYVDEFGGPK